MAKSKRRMTAAEFEAIRPLLHISQDRIAASRSVLVDGLTLNAAAAPFGWVRQSVDDAVSVVWKILQEYRTGLGNSANVKVLLPPGWEQVTVIAPTALIERFRAEIAMYGASGTGDGDARATGNKRRTPSRTQNKKNS